jgi:protein-S-isoprenylcysteine O-methyltransferase Ste14
MIKKRSLALLILFSIITLGIYGLYWIHKLAKDVNAICEWDGKKTGGLLKYLFFGLITLGIYAWVWLFLLGDRLQDTAPRYGLTFKESGGIILLWYLLGSFIIVGPFVAMYIIIKNVNALAAEYNKKNTAAAV